MNKPPSKFAVCRVNSRIRIRIILSSYRVNVSVWKKMELYVCELLLLIVSNGAVTVIHSERVGISQTKYVWDAKSKRKWEQMIDRNFPGGDKRHKQNLQLLACLPLPAHADPTCSEQGRMLCYPAGSGE